MAEMQPKGSLNGDGVTRERESRHMLDSKWIPEKLEAT